MDAVLRLVSDGVNADRKRIGSGSDILHAHPCAALSQEKLRIRPYKEPVREGIQSPRVTAHVLARLTDSTNSPVLLSRHERAHGPSPGGVWVYGWGNDLEHERVQGAGKTRRIRRGTSE